MLLHNYIYQFIRKNKKKNRENTEILHDSEVKLVLKNFHEGEGESRW